MTPENQYRLRRRVAEYYMSADRDTSSKARPTLRYMICSSPRSGSTLLADYLTRTELAGCPLEYLNDVYIRHYGETAGTAHVDFKSYIADLESRRSSSNLVFGMKAHFSQLSVAFKNANTEIVDRFINGFDHFLLIERRDKIAQAVSWYRALSTGIWSSKHAEMSGESEVLPKCDPLTITRTLLRIMEEESNWRKALADRGRTGHTVYYEDLAQAPGRELEEVFRALGIQERPPVWPNPSLSPQGDGYNQLCKTQYLNFITGAGISN
jgi:LPS sulfotransferase NodH